MRVGVIVLTVGYVLGIILCDHAWRALDRERRRNHELERQLSQSNQTAEYWRTRYFESLKLGFWQSGSGDPSELGVVSFDDSVAVSKGQTTREIEVDPR